MNMNRNESRALKVGSNSNENSQRALKFSREDSKNEDGFSYDRNYLSGSNKKTKNQRVEEGEIECERSKLIEFDDNQVLKKVKTSKDSEQEIILIY